MHQRTWIALLLLALSVATTARAEQVAYVPDRFERILDQLHRFDLGDDAHLQRLVSDLDRYSRHRRRDYDARVADTAEVLEKMVAHMQADKIKEALAKAIEAQGLSVDDHDVLKDPRVIDLLDRAEASAGEAARDGDWLEVLSIYRRIGLLYETRNPYREQEKRAEQRVRILGLYAPHALRQLHTDRLRRLGEEVPEEQSIEIEPWSQVLGGVEAGMFEEALAQADKHVSSPKLNSLLLGAIDQLLLLLDCKHLEGTFASLSEPKRVSRFRGYLLTQRRKIEDRRFDLFPGQIHNVLDGILAENAKSTNLPRRVVIYEMTEGAMSRLDQFSEVIWPYRLEQFERSTRGNFTGVGIQIGLDEDQHIKVVTPILKTPAYRAGIKTGDLIIKVDSNDTVGWSLDKAVREITGPEGTFVLLTVRRPGHPLPIDFRVRRARIPIESVAGWQLREDNTWSYYIDRDNKIGYVRLKQFIPQSADDLRDAINEMRNDAGLSALILDLRYNPGGLLSQAIEVANIFVRSGRIVSTVGPGDIQTSTYSAYPHRAMDPMDLVVLTNQGSASASEIVAGALQDYGRATIVGTRSYGKGSVQDLYPVDNAAVLKLTTQYYKLPGNRIIHREPDSETWGIEPDVKVEVTDQQTIDALELRQKADVLFDPDMPADPNAPPVRAEQIVEEGLDPQLETALLVLKTRLLADKIRMAQGREEINTP